MKRGPLGDPFSEETSLTHTPHGHFESEGTHEHHHHADGEGCSGGEHAHPKAESKGEEFSSADELVDRAVESAVVRAMFGGNDMARRAFIDRVGRATFYSALASVFPLAACKSNTKEEVHKIEQGAKAESTAKPLEKTDLKVGFVPITCATPIIMAHPLGFYKKYGLNVEVIKTAGWAVARDKSLSKEYDASHMLTPMPLAITLGAGSTAEPYLMPAVENINGQAITLHIDHKDKRDPKQWKGFKFAVPFDYSMHNFLLRYYVAEHGLDPDKDIQIRVLPPPEMVANLKAMLLPLNRTSSVSRL
jgi:nitrate/nitrite transport system substrate-binding protein